MTFVKGLLGARSHLAFLFGLCGALVTIAFLDVRILARPPLPVPLVHPLLPPAPRVAPPIGPERAPVVSPAPTVAPPAPPAPPVALRLDPALRPSAQPLTDEEKAWARSAWRYFEANTDRRTGLVGSVDGYPSTTLWDTGSYLMALIAAHQLGIVNSAVFDRRLDRALESLAALPLVDNLLPNKAYDTRTLAMVDYTNHATPKGIGWSAIDIARLAVPFTVIAWRYPLHTAKVKAVVARWKLDELVAHGELVGARRVDGRALERVQEGRFGYEQYAARSLVLLGLDAGRAARFDTSVASTIVSGERIVHDARRPADHGGEHNPVLSEPYVLLGVEFGLDDSTLPLARALLRAQEARFRQTGHLTAVSEDHIDRPPYFVYSSVIDDQRPWAVFASDGKPADGARTLSLKSALGWSYLFRGEYSDQLRSAVPSLIDPARGFYAGRYEEGGAINRALTANTNGIVLETLLFHARGPIVRQARVN